MRCGTVEKSEPATRGLTNVEGAFKFKSFSDNDLCIVK